MFFSERVKRIMYLAKTKTPKVMIFVIIVMYFFGWFSTGHRPRAGRAPADLWVNIFPMILRLSNINRPMTVRYPAGAWPVSVTFKHHSKMSVRASADARPITGDAGRPPADDQTFYPLYLWRVFPHIDLVSTFSKSRHVFQNYNIKGTERQIKKMQPKKRS